MLIDQTRARFSFTYPWIRTVSASIKLRFRAGVAARKDYRQAKAATTRIKKNLRINIRPPYTQYVTYTTPPFTNVSFFSTFCPLLSSSSSSLLLLLLLSLLLLLLLLAYCVAWSCGYLFRKKCAVVKTTNKRYICCSCVRNWFETSGRVGKIRAGSDTISISFPILFRIRANFGWIRQ